MQETPAIVPDRISFVRRSGSHFSHFRLLVVLVVGAVELAGAPPIHSGNQVDDNSSSIAAESGSTAASETNNGKESEDAEDEKKEKNAVRAHYKDGLRLESEDGNFAAKINWRLQTRATELSSDDLVGEEDGLEEEAGFRIRRARFKLRGHAYRPWLGYYLEYGIAGNVLLTWEFNLERFEKIGLRVGQYKVLYNRERVDSSGKQQFADRSIVNNPFTVDRQQGLTAMGHLFKGSRGDSRYAVGVFTGTGRGGGNDGDRRPMYSGRWQWNFLKRDLPFAQSDVEMQPDPAGSLAFAASSNVSPYTRFSSAGGGQLPGFDNPDGSDRYKLEQWMAEFAYQGRGLSIQGEYHFKRIDDMVDDQITDLDGFYTQVGYFFHGLFNGFPRPLELAARYARVHPVAGVPTPADREATVAANWFFHGHNNKLTADYSRLENSLPFGSKDTGWRLRVQWDITF